MHVDGAPDAADRVDDVVHQVDADPTIGLADAVRDLATRTNDTVAGLAHALCGHCVALIGDACRVHLADDAGTLVLAAAVPADAGRGWAHLEARHGPAPAVVARGVTVVDTRLDRTGARWPALQSLLHRDGYRALLCLPLATGDDAIGALTVLRCVGGFDASRIAMARALAGVVGAAAYGRSGLDQALRQSAQLQQALDSRVHIEQAKGIVAGLTGMTPAESFARLRTYARNRSEPLRDVCTAVIDGDLDVAVIADGGRD